MRPSRPSRRPPCGSPPARAGHEVTGHAVLSAVATHLAWMSTISRSLSVSSKGTDSVRPELLLHLEAGGGHAAALAVGRVETPAARRPL